MISPPLEMTLEELISLAVRRSISDEEILACATAIRASKDEVFNRFATSVASRFLGTQLSFAEADWAMIRLAERMYGDLRSTPETYVFPEPAWSIYLAFDAGEFDLGDGVDRVEKHTKPQLRDLLDHG